MLFLFAFLICLKKICYTLVFCILPAFESDPWHISPSFFWSVSWLLFPTWLFLIVILRVVSERLQVLCLFLYAGIFAYVQLCILLWACTDMYMHTYIYRRQYTYIHVYYIYIYTHTYLYKFIYMLKFSHTHTYIYIYIYIYMYIYTHIYCRCMRILI